MSERRTVGRKPSPEIDLARDVGHSSPLASTISAVSFEGLTITSSDGEPATLAVVDRDGRIVQVEAELLEKFTDWQTPL
ncbi:hypothetical protein F4827_000717 [Paraburkholderia bannensis]|uniref:Uncharacterized protein n=1 Tax=Paraburkholderia bannensis TaxID=765414 RepID=A0A7W9TSW4_9BURK|nr:MULTISPECIES: hypothetical protein [Paraburkholderia]MBB3255891.1 hypothetical protein [Paraburkholderia sp. WP4_3_2]MBB6100891.1 hypothetical protein [Paraburkholderia bannensis]